MAPRNDGVLMRLAMDARLPLGPQLEELSKTISDLERKLRPAGVIAGKRRNGPLIEVALIAISPLRRYKKAAARDDSVARSE